MDNDFNLDKVLMLLSADWFEQFCKELGLVLSEKEYGLIKQAARTGVTDFMQGEGIYWNIDFTAKRSERTEHAFVENLQKAKLSQAVIDQVLALSKAISDGDELENTTVWLLGVLTEQLVVTPATDDSTIFTLRKETLALLKALWDESDALTTWTAHGVEQAAMGSSTKWDIYLRALTPDLPSYLADVAAVELKVPQKFRRFWAQLYWVISKEERASLIEWYRAETEKIADASFHFTAPKWLRNI